MALLQSSCSWISLIHTIQLHTSGRGWILQVNEHWIIKLFIIVHYNIKNYNFQALCALHSNSFRRITCFDHKKSHFTRHWEGASTLFSHICPWLDRLHLEGGHWRWNINMYGHKDILNLEGRQCVWWIFEYFLPNTAYSNTNIEIFTN